jgi:GNAT superfamily N-acetyltransferase
VQSTLWVLGTHGYPKNRKSWGKAVHARGNGGRKWIYNKGRLPKGKVTMQELPFEQWTAAVRSLLGGVETEPAGIRAAGVLDRRVRGRIFVDRPAAPAWAVLQESAFGSLYLGGQLTAPVLAGLVERLRADGDVLVGLWPEDARLNLFPRPAEYEGRCLDFYQRDRAVLLERFLSLPPGFRMEPATPENLRGRASAELMIAAHGSLERALETEWGYLLYEGEQLAPEKVVCESILGAPIRGMVEPGVETAPAFRGQGLATFLCAYLIRECERQGYETWWNTNRANLPSAGLARKLGYQVEKEYVLLGWPKTGTKFS